MFIEHVLGFNGCHSWEGYFTKSRWPRWEEYFTGYLSVLSTCDTCFIQSHENANSSENPSLTEPSCVCACACTHTNTVTLNSTVLSLVYCRIWLPRGLHSGPREKRRSQTLLKESKPARSARALIFQGSSICLIVCFTVSKAVSFQTWLSFGPGISEIRFRLALNSCPISRSATSFPQKMSLEISLEEPSRNEWVVSTIFCFLRQDWESGR